MLQKECMVAEITGIAYDVNKDAIGAGVCLPDGRKPAAAIVLGR